MKKTSSPLTPPELQLAARQHCRMLDKILIEVIAGGRPVSNADSAVSVLLEMALLCRGPRLAHRLRLGVQRRVLQPAFACAQRSFFLLQVGKATAKGHMAYTQGVCSHACRAYKSLQPGAASHLIESKGPNPHALPTSDIPYTGPLNIRAPLCAQRLVADNLCTVTAVGAKD